MTPRERTTRTASRRKPEEPAAAGPNETIQIGAIESQPAKDPGVPTRKFSRPKRIGLGVWLGLFLAAAGFGLIAVTWGKTAGLVNVAEQIPYLVSGGLTGLGLILVGLLVINLSVKRREALERARQLEEVRDALVRLRAAIEGDPGDHR
jgi:hypothetical protein